MSKLQWQALCLGPFQTNTYLVADGAHAILVDPSFEPEPILAAVAEAGVRVETIVLTHGHIDHVSAVGPVHERLGGDIVIHEADEPLYHHAPRSARRFGLALAPPPPITRHLAEGDAVRCGTHTARVIHTPGHTPGGVCLHFADDELLLSGDTLFAGSIGRTDLPGGSFDQIDASIRDKLYPLQPQTVVLPGHGPPTTVGDERARNPFVRP